MGLGYLTRPYASFPPYPTPDCHPPGGRVLSIDGAAVSEYENPRFGLPGGSQAPEQAFDGNSSVGYRLLAMSSRYYALTRRAPGPSGGSELHLVREDSEASLCGIPRTSLTNGGIFDVLVCNDCVEWLPKRMEFSRRMRKVDRS